MKYYIAYGSNLNKAQMRQRCKDAVPLGTAVINDYELVFRGRRFGAVATIEPKKGSAVPVGIWKISKDDEKSLDVYEGFPRLYVKQNFTVNLYGKDIEAMAYVMTPGKRIESPSDFYFDTIRRGYADFGLDEAVLMNAANIQMDDTTSVIEAFARYQREHDEPICPRCGEYTMLTPLHYNCLSRRARIFICEKCGMEEAIADYRGDEDPLSNWYASAE